MASYVLAVLGVAVVLFVTEWLAMELVALLVILALILGGVLPARDALSGLSDPLVVTIGALFVVGAAVQETGLGTALGERLARLAGSSERRLIAATMLGASSLSAFMSTTGAVALLMPVVVAIGRRAGVAPSRLLMPLAFGGHLGSTLTLVATPPNLVASDQLTGHGLPPLGFFSFTPYGVVLLAMGAAYMIVVARRVLPTSSQEAAERPTTAPPPDPSRRLTGQLARLSVPSIGQAVGRTIAEVLPRSRTGVTVIARSTDGERFTAAGPRTVLGAGDLLVVHGPPEAVGRLAATAGLASTPGPTAEVDPAAQGAELGTVEALLTPHSALLGSSLGQVRLRDRTGITALMIVRQGKVLDGLADERLAMGDVLLLHGPWSKLALLRDDRDLVVLGRLAPRRPSTRGALIVAATLLAMVALMASSVVPTVVAALLAAVVVVVTRCVALEDAYRAVSWGSLLLIAGMLPMATALERTGVIASIIEWLTATLGPLGPAAALVGLLALTNVLGLVLSNTATAVLVAPIAYDLAVRLGASPRTWLLGVALASSMAFSTPVSSPVNVLVSAPGGYGFMDFVRVGVPLQLLALVVMTALLLLFGA